MSDTITAEYLSGYSMIRITNGWTPKYNGYILFDVSLTIGVHNGIKICAYTHSNDLRFGNYGYSTNDNAGTKTQYNESEAVSKKGIYNSSSDIKTTSLSIPCYVNRGYPVFLCLKNSETSSDATFSVKINGVSVKGSIKEI